MKFMTGLGLGLLIIALESLHLVQGQQRTCPASALGTHQKATCPIVDEIDEDGKADSLDASISWKGPHACLGDYCIFSNRRISKHPWAIVATAPEAAANLTNYFDLMPNRISQPWSPPYYLTELPGKGRGLVAKRAITKGERILAEDAILLLDMQAHLQLPEGERRQLHDLILRSLPWPARDEFLSQVGENMSSILERNGFEIHTGRAQDVVTYVGAFPQQALVNHDCRPNLAYHFRGVTHITTAVRDIQAGEELTLSYIDVTRPLAYRKHRLRSTWKFDCGCEHCALPAAEAEASDGRMKRIDQLENVMDHPVESFPAGKLTPQAGAELVRLYEHERLHVYIGYAYRRAALNYSLFGDEDKARSCAHKALQALSWQGGEKQKDVENMRILRDDPKRHWSWKRLSRARER